jgi:hypothetical protein
MNARAILADFLSELKQRLLAFDVAALTTIGVK